MTAAEKKKADAEAKKAEAEAKKAEAAAARKAASEKKAEEAAAAQRAEENQPNPELATLPAKNDEQTKLEHSKVQDAAAATDLQPTAGEATFVPDEHPERDEDEPKFAGEVDAALYHQARARFG